MLSRVSLALILLLSTLSHAAAETGARYVISDPLRFEDRAHSYAAGFLDLTLRENGEVLISVPGAVYPCFAEGCDERDPFQVADGRIDEDGRLTLTQSTGPGGDTDVAFRQLVVRQFDGAVVLLSDDRLSITRGVSFFIGFLRDRDGRARAARGLETALASIIGTFREENDPLLHCVVRQFLAPDGAALGPVIEAARVLADAQFLTTGSTFRTRRMIILGDATEPDEVARRMAFEGDLIMLMVAEPDAGVTDVLPGGAFENHILDVYTGRRMTDFMTELDIRAMHARIIVRHGDRLPAARQLYRGVEALLARPPAEFAERVCSDVGSLIR